MKTAITLMLLTACGSASALDIKGITPGMTESQAAEQVGELECFDRDYVRLCGADVSYGGNEHAEMFMALLDGKVTRVSVDFPHGAFGPVADGLTKKFGPPARDESSVVKNAMGAEFDARELVWQDGDIEMRAGSRGDDLTEATVALSSASAERALMEARSRSAADEL